MQIKLYHCATQQEATKYQENRSKESLKGFDTLQAAMYWCIETGRKVIYIMECNTNSISLCSDYHHNDYGKAYWCDINIKDIKCVVSL